MNGEHYNETTIDNTVDIEIDKRKCMDCRCWRVPSDFIGVRGNEVKRCKKCRESDTKRKQKPETAERKKAMDKEKKYYQAYRDRKRAEDEEAYKKKCAEASKAWRDKQKENHSTGDQGSLPHMSLINESEGSLQ